MTTNRFFLLLAAIVLPLVFVGCDAVGGGGDTATFNAGSTFPPTVVYQFEYDSSNQVAGRDLVEVVSSAADNLGDVLSDNGFDRGTVVSARVDSVRFIQVSDPGKEGAPAPKFVFDNLLGADVFLGTDENGVQIASGNFDPNDTSEEVTLGVTTRDVTQVVKNGATRAFLRLETTGDVTRTDRVNVEVYYEITVSGV